MAASTVSTSDAVTAYRTVLNEHAGLIDDRPPYDQGAYSTIEVGGAWESSVGTPGEAGRVFLVTSGLGSVPLLFRDTGTGWRIESSPSFSAKPADATSSIANATATKVVLGTEEWDDLASGGTAGYLPASSRFVPTVAGVWEFTGYVQFLDALTDGCSVQVVLYKNGALHRVLTYEQAAAASVGGYGGSALATANGTTDYFELFAYQDSGSSRRVNVDTYFQGRLARPA